MQFVKVMQLVHRLHTDSNGRFFYSSVIEELSEVLYSGKNFTEAQDFYYAYYDNTFYDMPYLLFAERIMNVPKIWVIPDIFGPLNIK